MSWNVQMIYKAEANRERWHRQREERWLLIGMIAIGIFFVACLHSCTNVAYGAEIKQEFIAGYSIDAWADAVKRAENNDNYGILSIPCNKGADCRRICKNSLRNGWKRYKVAKGLPMSYRGNSADLKGFVEHFAKRYCPVGASNDNGTNRFWVKNVLWFLNNTKGA